MEPSLVSVIIPAYNAGEFLAATLDSLLVQTWERIEIIVVNDGSSDETLTIAESYKHKGVITISQENKGQDVAINNGYAYSKGSYIKFMDADDMLNPEMIEIQMNTLNGSDEYVAYGEWARFYNDKAEFADFTPLDYWKDASPLDFLTARPESVMLQCGIMLVPRKLVDTAGLWDERLILYNDTEFFNRVILKSKGIKFSAGARLYYRSGMNHSISAGRTRKFFESTFLATNLIASQLLAAEDSHRVRNLIGNVYLDQYYRLYPCFPDLMRAHEEKIALYPEADLKPDGGKILKFLSWLFGWKAAKRIKGWIYKLGYQPKPISG